MQNLVIYCKSYSKDLSRVLNLAKSIALYNQDHLPFYVSVPDHELDLFGQHLKDFDLKLISDEEIVSKSLAASGLNQQDIVGKMPVHLWQQIIKSEFWRLGLSADYLVIDSDSYFIQPFRLADFMWDENIPYTVMHECKDFLQFAARQGIKKIKRDYIELRQRFQSIFGRKGRYFDFGPTPVIWSSCVWNGLYKDYAEAKNTNIFEMFSQYPCELMWYGEYLLHSRILPIIPIEPLFKVYNYREQFEEGVRMGENEKVLAENFLGIVRQSNWDKALDYLDYNPPKRRKKSIFRLFSR